MPEDVKPYKDIEPYETPSGKRLEEKLEQLVKNLADPMKWNWARQIFQRDAADNVLREMAKLGIIGHRRHPLGGDTWIVGEKMFGRVDGVPSKEK